MGRQQPTRGNARRHFQRAHRADVVLRASLASMYAAADAAPVDTRNAAVVVTLGAEESSSSSSDSESSGTSVSSEPYGEPSPPKSIPKPCCSVLIGQGTKGNATSEMAALYSPPNASKGMVHEDKRLSDLTSGKKLTGVRNGMATQHGFSPMASGVSFSSSLCTTEGTASLNSSSSSVHVGTAAGSPTTDDGKLHVAELAATSTPSQINASNADSKLPPKLVFTFKSIPEESIPHPTKPEEAKRDTGTTTTASASSPVLQRKETGSFCTSESAAVRPTPSPFVFEEEALFFFQSSHASPMHNGGQAATASMSDGSTIQPTGSPTPLIAFAATRATFSTKTSAAFGRSTTHSVSEGASASDAPISEVTNSPTGLNDVASTLSNAAMSPTGEIVGSFGHPKPRLAPPTSHTTGNGDTDAAMTNSADTTSCTPSTTTLGSFIETKTKNTPTRRFPFGFDSDAIRIAAASKKMYEQATVSSHEMKDNASITNAGIESMTSTSTESAPNEASPPTQCSPPSGTTYSPSCGFSLFDAPIHDHAPMTQAIDTASPSPFSGGSAATSAPKVSKPYAMSAFTSLSSITLEISDASRIACGRSGKIYLARSEASQLAVKVATRPTSKTANARFQRELMTLRNLPEHPYIVEHHGCMVLPDADQIGVITDMVVGSQTWHSHLYSTPASPPVDMKVKHRVLLQILDAVAFLHAHDVTHRDLSLKHVLRSYGSLSPAIKLIDFGLPTLRAAARSGNSGFTAADWVGVTPEYASPEVLRGELSCHDNEGWKKSDIFSFAILMAELLREERPWDGESPVYVIKAVAARGERPFNARGVRLFGRRCPELEAIVDRAWHEDPFVRPTAQELLVILQSLFANSSSGDPANKPPLVIPNQSVRTQEDVSVVKAETAPSCMRPVPNGFGSPSYPGVCFPTFRSGVGSLPEAPPAAAPFSFSTPLPNVLPSTRQADVSPASGLAGSANATLPAIGAHPLPNFFSAAFAARPALSSFKLTVCDKTRVAQGNRGATYRSSCEVGEVAVKIMNKPTTQRSCARLDKEIITLKDLPAHPHLVRHYGSVSLAEGSQCGIVTDFVFAADPISSRLYRTLSIKEVDKHRILLQTIDALAYLHAHGITHRDLSWKHVLYTYSSPLSIKLVDFGLPTLRGSITSNAGSATFAMVGSTLEYASPEALRGELSNREDEGWERCNGGWAKKNDYSMASQSGWKESDVYSFATLLLEMLLEEKPWEGEPPIYILNAVSKQGKRPFKVEDVRVFGEASPALEVLIQEAWHDDPLKRPTALELKTRLEHILRSN